MGQVDDRQDEWLDEFVARHSLRERHKEDARQEQWEISKEGNIAGETAMTTVGYLLGFLISYGVLALVMIGLFFFSFVAAVTIMIKLIY